MTKGVPDQDLCEGLGPPCTRLSVCSMICHRSAQLGDWLPDELFHSEQSNRTYARNVLLYKSICCNVACMMHIRSVTHVE